MPASIRRCSPWWSRMPLTNVPFLLSRSSIIQVSPRPPLPARLRRRRACSPDSAMNGRLSSTSGAAADANLLDVVGELDEALRGRAPSVTGL